ncbi:Cof-type HAD-IIB family hydrolase [Lacticaseibacillus nasuensis]|uniref:Hydrolase of the HAD superfamily protein n=1 Tax=Lacticaseibacillus nasuensis JCM 17158 TaxID=1291734 RepID=A0A0R1JGU8_9LACO|nr:Cof-type HAD-IIB family hydrolase [Lacticaseibacillus nasuensis]KRK70544.1 hydrolase of the HAD superfamily protein [Lacticaseibacillus nasuensis JCM 17158]
MAPHLIISDIDGTLAVDHTRVTPRTAATLSQLLDAGHEFYVASGRMYNLAHPIASQVDSRAEIIAANGAVYDFNGERVHHLLGAAALRATAEAAIAHRVTPMYFSDDQLFYITPPPADIQAGLEIFAPAENHIDLIETGDVAGLLQYADRITNGLILSFTNVPALAEIRTALNAGGTLHVSASEPTNLELIPAHVDKAVAIRELQAKTGIPPERTIVFGDGLNDVGMLRAAGIAVAMGNALPEVKAVADHVTGANTEDGLAQFLETYFA